MRIKFFKKHLISYEMRGMIKVGTNNECPYMTTLGLEFFELKHIKKLRNNINIQKLYGFNPLWKVNWTK